MIPSPRQAIIDIGSNSIRLVIFGGPPRAPAVLYNEKLMAALGRGVVEGGRLDPAAAEFALAGLARFAAIVSLLGPVPVRAVATAAVREAADGREFLDRVRALGLPAEILDGDGEAVAAGYGVISGAPDADGLVADMGGGSLELVRVAGGRVGNRISLPLGAMRVAEIRSRGPGKLRKKLHTLLARLSWTGEAAGRPLYIVGGSWRALARVHMNLRGWPLPVLGNYSFPADDAKELKALVRAMGPEQLATIPGVKAARLRLIDDASALLAALVSELQPSRIIVSSQGLREGLLYSALDTGTKALDPLIEGIRHAVGAQQLPQATDALLAWTAPIFAGEAPDAARLRHAAYLLAETGWASNPDFRVIEGEDLAFHGNWSGVDPEGRALMATALHVGLGGDPQIVPVLVARLARAERIGQAVAWGHAFRLGRRLSGNNALGLAAMPLRRDDANGLVLAMPSRLAALVDGGVQKRLADLAGALGLEARIEPIA